MSLFSLWRRLLGVFRALEKKKTRLFFNIARLLGTLALQRYGRREGGGVSYIDGVRKLDFSP